MHSEYEKLGSGKAVMRHFADDGSLVHEQHCYGLLDIGITFAFREGKKIEELYFAKRRMVSRRTYEKSRAAYPDMPAPDYRLEDLSGNLLTDLRRNNARR